MGIVVYSSDYLIKRSHEDDRLTMQAALLGS